MPSTDATTTEITGTTPQSSGGALPSRLPSTGSWSVLASGLAELIGKFTAAMGATFLAACVWRLLASDRPAWLVALTLTLIPVTLAPMSAWPALATGAAGVVSAAMGRNKQP